MNILQFKDVVKMGYRIGRPVCALSAPGQGKSSVIYQASQELSVEYDTKFGMIEIRGASSSPAELAAIKYVAKEEVQEAEQAWVPTKEKVDAGLVPKRGFIFCDEITSSMPAVQSTLQRLFLDRKLGGLTLADGWYVVAAGNRAKDKSAAGNLSRAFANRCIMVGVEPDPDVFYDWGVENGIDYRVLAFVRFRTECLADGLTVDKRENIAFCSPRSMHIVSDVLRDSVGLPEALLFETITGTIGDGVGSEFCGFMKIMDNLPDLGKLLKSPDTYPVPKETNVQYATIGALHSRANEDNMKAVMQFFIRLPTEMSVVAIKDLAKIHKDKVFKLPEFIKWSTNVVRFTA